MRVVVTGHDAFRVKTLGNEDNTRQLLECRSSRRHGENTITNWRTSITTYNRLVTHLCQLKFEMNINNIKVYLNINIFLFKRQMKMKTNKFSYQFIPL